MGLNSLMKRHGYLGEYGSPPVHVVEACACNSLTLNVTMIGTCNNALFRVLLFAWSTELCLFLSLFIYTPVA